MHHKVRLKPAPRSACSGQKALAHTFIQLFPATVIAGAARPGEESNT